MRHVDVPLLAHRLMRAAVALVIVGLGIVVLAASLMVGGCGHTFSGQAMALDLSPRAPARLVVTIDGTEVLVGNATGPASISVSCPVGSSPGYVGGNVACVGDE